MRWGRDISIGAIFRLRPDVVHRASRRLKRAVDLGRAI
jgi:hypothetical protein